MAVPIRLESSPQPAHEELRRRLDEAPAERRGMAFAAALLESLGRRLVATES
jgi:hypothetical protein